MEIRKIDFIKIAGRWFPVFPDYEGSADDLEMVDESARFLDELYNRGFERDGLVSFIVWDKKLPISDIILEKYSDENEVGMHYKVLHGIKGLGDNLNTMWFFPVFEYYFNGIYPEKIYINILYKENLKKYVS